MGTLFQLVEGHLAPAPGQMLLKADDAATFFAAGEILAALQDKARQLEETAGSAYRQRHEEGYRDGLAAGKMEYAGKILETVMSSVEYLEHLEISMVRIIGEIVRKLLGEMPRDELVIRLVRQALQAVKSERKVTIRIAARDEAAVREGLAAMLQSHDGVGSFIDLLPDPDLPPGSCVLESEMGVIEASLETQLKNLENALLSRIKQGAG